MGWHGSAGAKATLAIARAILYKPGFPNARCARTLQIRSTTWPSRNEKHRRRAAGCAVPPTRSRSRPTSRTRIPASCAGRTTSISRPACIAAGRCSSPRRTCDAVLRERAKARIAEIMYLIAFPLLIIPFALYNMVLFLLNLPFTDTVFSLPLWPPDRRMPVSTGEVIVGLALFLLYVEVVKAVRLGGKGFMDHLLALIVFAGMASELALVPQAATPTLLMLTAIGFVDVITGMSVSVRRKRRQVAYEDQDQAHA